MTDSDINLLLRSFDEQLDTADQERLKALLESSPEADAERARFMHLRSMLTTSRADAFAPGFAGRVLRQTARQPEQVSTGWIERLAVAVGPWRLAAGVAASVAILFAAGLVLWMQPKTVTVPYGTTEVVRLSDGSTVELGGGSTITYRRFIGRSTRTIVFEGQAFFDVASDDRPFVVETFNAIIRVFGTSFNVRAWPADPSPETEVALAEGGLTVEPRGAGANRTLAMQGVAQPVMLEPGQVTTVLADSMAAPRSISLEQTLAWRTGGIAAAERRLESVFLDLERRFNVRITATDRRILDRTVTYLNPAPDSAADVLADICHTLDLRYRRTAGGFEVLLPENQPGD